jgi:hypothetical protein
MQIAFNLWQHTRGLLAVAVARSGSADKEENRTATDGETASELVIIRAPREGTAP